MIAAVLASVMKTKEFSVEIEVEITVAALLTVCASGACFASACTLVSSNSNMLNLKNQETALQEPKRIEPVLQKLKGFALKVTSMGSESLESLEGQPRANAGAILV